MAPKVERNYVKVADATLKRETTMAMLVHFGDINEELWVPKSITKDFDEAAGTIEVQDWWLKRNGLL